MLPGSLPVYPVFECLLPSRRKRERVDGRQGDCGEERGESLGCGVVGTRRKQLEAFAECKEASNSLRKLSLKSTEQG